jgi:hypothetical protein
MVTLHIEGRSDGQLVRLLSVLLSQSVNEMVSKSVT